MERTDFPVDVYASVGTLSIPDTSVLSAICSLYGCSYK